MTRVWKRVVAKRGLLSEKINVDGGGAFHVCGVAGSEMERVFKIRFAVYESSFQPPRVVLFQDSDVARFMRQAALDAHEMAHSMGSVLPAIIFKELLDNLIHCEFSDPLVTLQDDGNTLTVSDHGDGIECPEKALQPGYSTATERMREHIRGVGSGLPLVNEILQKMGGQLLIERNLSEGTVVRASLNGVAAAFVQKELSVSGDQRAFHFPISGGEDRWCNNNSGLSDREKHVLLLLAEVDSAGPTKVAKELDISLSTAHRDLAKLERQSLLRSLPNGKKKLTEEGLGQLELIFSSAESIRPGKASQLSSG